MTEVTRILSQIEDGDPSVAEQLLPLVYDELRKLAAQRLANEQPGQTLHPTDLVHEAYIRLVDTDEAQHWNSRGHFFGAAAEAMRRILVDHARTKQSVKKGRNFQRLDANLDQLSRSKNGENILEIDEALERLGDQNTSVAKLVELKYFGGLTIDQAASALDVSSRTAHRYWAYAKAWLHHEIGIGRQ